jgi:branched-chain amino acid transport system substrate-binding protein
MQLYKNILSQYGKNVAGGLGSFSEMGYLLGKFSVGAMQTIKNNDYSLKSVNAAFKAIKDQKTELLCQPWVYGDYPLHIPNNADFTTTPENGKMVTAQQCFNVSSADPQIAQYRKAAGTAASTNPPTS